MRLHFWLKRCEHTEQRNGFSPACASCWCVTSCALSVKLTKQLGQVRLCGLPNPPLPPAMVPLPLPLSPSAAFPSASSSPLPLLPLLPPSSSSPASSSSSSSSSSLRPALGFANLWVCLSLPLPLLPSLSSLSSSSSPLLARFFRC